MPGKRLKRISGRPNFALRSAMITLHDRAVSKPPPRASPWTSATVTIGWPIARQIVVDDVDADHTRRSGAAPRVLLANRLGEEAKVAAEVEDAGRPGGDDEEIEGALGLRGLREALAQAGLHGADVAQQPRGDARAILRIEMAPEHTILPVERQIDIGVGLCPILTLLEEGVDGGVIVAGAELTGDRRILLEHVVSLELT